MTTTAQTLPQSSSAPLARAAELGGRLLLSALFILSGVGKLGAYAGTAAYMASAGVPGALLPLVIALEIGGGLAILLGWYTRIVAFLLAGFTLIAAFVFHSHFADQIQMIMFWKNVSITGGLLLLVVHGAGAWSIDGRAAK